jgi:predicted TIM-barrel fold metal-dependent hydrolase
MMGKDPVSPKTLLAGMDKSGVDRLVALSFPPPVVVWGRKTDTPPVRGSVDLLNKVVSQTGGRVIPFVWADPSLPGCLDDIRYAIEEKKFKGVKLIPTLWDPFDEGVWPVYELIRQYRVPILFHSGIIWLYGDASRRCRPVNYEIMMKYPEIRFALAHCSWPWTDECIAVSGKFNAMKKRGELPQGRQMFIDMTPGTPASYRKDVFKRMFSMPAYCFEEQILFGTDGLLSDYGNPEIKSRIRQDREILKSLKLSKKVQDAYFSGNFEKYLGA